MQKAVITLRFQQPFNPQKITDSQFEAIANYFKQSAPQLPQTKTNAPKDTSGDTFTLDEVKELYGDEYKEEIALAVFTGNFITYDELEQFDALTNQANPVAQIQRSRELIDDLRKGSLDIQAQEAVMIGVNRELYLHELEINAGLETRAQLNQYSLAQERQSNSGYLDHLTDLQSQVASNTAEILREMQESSLRIIEDNSNKVGFTQKQISNLYSSHSQKKKAIRKSPLGNVKKGK